MPTQSRNRALSAFLKALREEEIDCILIGAMAAIEHGAPIGTVDYDFWVHLPERQYIRIWTFVHRQGGQSLGKTLFLLRDGTMVNIIFKPDGLRSFKTEFKHCKLSRLEGQPIRILPLERVIASKRAANRDKDQVVLPVLERTLRCMRRLRTKKHEN